MYIIPIAWLYVALMMAVAEATNSNGTVLGAIVTFVLYGLLPIGLILYFIGSGARRRTRRAQEAEERAAYVAKANAAQGAPSHPPDEGSVAPADTIAPVRKEP
jgi:hypothetical protein